MNPSTLLGPRDIKPTPTGQIILSTEATLEAFRDLIDPGRKTG